MVEIKRRIRHSIKYAAPKVAAIYAMSLLSIGAANAQTPSPNAQAPSQNAQPPSPEVIARLRAMGISADTKSLPAWATPPGMHRSDTVPSNFPIPVYRSNVYGTTFFNSTSGAASASVSISTRDQPAVVNQFYQSSLVSSGWKTRVPTPEALAKMGAPGQFYMIQGYKDIQTFSMTIRTNPQVAGSVILITWYINQNSKSK